MGRIAQRQGQGKKLRAAARYWARGGEDDGRAASEDADLLGIDADEASDWFGETDREDVFLVWPENWQTVRVFLAMATQWHVVAGMAGASFRGLYYPSLRSVYEGLGIRKKDIPDIFAGLQEMERAALEVIRRQEDDDQEEGDSEEPD